MIALTVGFSISQGALPASALASMSQSRLREMGQRGADMGLSAGSGKDGRSKSGKATASPNPRTLSLAYWFRANNTLILQGFLPALRF